MLHDNEPEFDVPGIVMRISFGSAGAFAAVALVAASAIGPHKISNSGTIRKRRLKKRVNARPLLPVCFAVIWKNLAFLVSA